MTLLNADCSTRIAAVRNRINLAAQSAGRDSASVKLVAVSKTHGIDVVRAALAAGQRVFGENRVQEAQQKFSIVRSNYPDLELHLIGALQSNKAEQAVRLFDVIETLDRPKLAESLAKAIQKVGRTPKFLIEVNVGAESQKAGIAPGEVPLFLNFCRHTCGLAIDGLMAIPPQGEDPVPYFKELRDLAQSLSLSVLSMGMSSDFETAIACGSTEVRVGTALFGSR